MILFPLSIVILKLQLFTKNWSPIILLTIVLLLFYLDGFIIK